jgi:hypothetical protein
MPNILPDPLPGDDTPPDGALPCVIDIEASGFGRGSYPIEVGIALPDGSAYCALVRPARDWTHWDREAERVHGISRTLLELHGRSAEEVAGELNRRLNGHPVYSDNWAHDYAWLAQLFETAGLRPSFNLHHLRELMSDDAIARFVEARAMIARGLPGRRHRASADARVLQLSVAWVRQEDRPA